MSTATLASASACWRAWCAQKRSSPEFASSTRTYAWAPHRSQTSSAVSGLVGAIAPVNVAFLASCLRPGWPSGCCFCPYSSAQHLPGRHRSPRRVVYATSENRAGQGREPACATRCLRPVGPACKGSPGSTQAPCVVVIPRPRPDEACATAGAGLSSRPRRGVPGAAGRGRYYFRMRPAWATPLSRREIGWLCPP